MSIIEAQLLRLVEMDGVGEGGGVECHIFEGSDGLINGCKSSFEVILSS